MIVLPLFLLSLLCHVPVSALKRCSVKTCTYCTCLKEGLTEVPNFGNPKVRTIDLDDNKIKKIHYDTFKKSELVIMITLNNNEIEYIEDNSFENLLHLDLLMLRNNKIRRFVQKFPGFVRTKLYISIGTNPLIQFNIGDSQADKFSLSTRLMGKFPKIGLSPRLRTIVLDTWSIIKDLSIGHLAPLCSLEEIIWMTLETNVDLKEQYALNPCECYRLYKWIEMKEIKGLGNISACPEYSQCSTNTFTFFPEEYTWLNCKVLGLEAKLYNLERNYTNDP